MECSETQQQVINLGRMLVNELGLEPGVDTLSKWMAHYISEQISIVDSVSGEEKSAAEKRCFETILQLWAYHDSYPGEHKPFKNFSPIFNAIASLSPDNKYPHNRSLYWTEKDLPDDVDIKQKEIGEWVNIALGVDTGAKILIEFALKQAVFHAVDEKTAEWLNNAVGLPTSDEVVVLRGFLDLDEEDDESNEREIERLKDRLDKLSTFEHFSAQLREELEERVAELSSK